MTVEFVALPDHPAGARIGARLRERAGVRVIDHPSGRPWVVGRWRDEDVTMASVGTASAVVLGCTTATAADLARRLEPVGTVVDVDVLATKLPGSFHLLASVGGATRVQGTLSGACQVFHGLVDGVPVASDRAQSIASLTGAALDEELVALQLVSMWPPWPLNERCPWRGVVQVPFGHYLRVDQGGRASWLRWWRPPPAEVPLSSAAESVREALVDAVEARRCGDRPVTADLSGGLDSTSLCFVAASRGVPLVTVHNRPLDPGNDDETWARLCASRMPGARHIVVDPSSGPGWYEASDLAAADWEAPLPSARGSAVIEELAVRVADLGATRHLQGLNGDELFHSSQSPMTIHALARRSLRLAVPHAQGLRVMRRWRLLDTARFLMSSEPYPRWLARTADTLTGERVWERPEFEWEIAPKLPSWATASSADAVRRLVRDAARDEPAPLDPLPAQHAIIRITLENGLAVRRISRIGEAFGVTFHSPYLDDRVLEAALSVRIEDRLQLGRFKPVLAEAMRGIAPEEFLSRKTKGDYSAEFYAGLDDQRTHLEEICDDSALARMGLVDADELRRMVRRIHPDSRPLAPLETTLATEWWLRSLPEQAAPAGVRQPTPMGGEP